MKPLLALTSLLLAHQAVCSAGPAPLASVGYFIPPLAVSKDQPCDSSPERSSKRPMKQFPHRIQIGGNYTRVNLKPQGSSSFNGNLGGAQGIYEYRPMNRFYGAAKLAWKEGDTHGASGKRSLLYIDTQERLGYTFGSKQGDWRLTLFSGFGYRYDGQELKPKHGSSVTFNYNEFYIPVGFLADHAFSSCFHLGINFTWMPQVFPTVGIQPLKGARWDLTYKLANFFVEMPFTFIFGRSHRWAIIFNPFYERWQDGHSFAKTSTGLKLGLPGNTYNFWGADLNLAYSF